MILHCVLAIAALTALPDAPKPKPVVIMHKAHPNRAWLAETATLGALYAADFTLTAKGLGTPCGTWQGCRRSEADPLYGRHPSDTRLALTTAAMFAADVLVLHKTEHSTHKWLRWSGRALFAYTVVDEARCIGSWSR